MKKNRGFTLIEILVVLVVIGILAAIAIPSYQNQVRKSTRSAAQAVMADIANKQIFYLQQQRAYAADLATLKYTVPDDVGNFYDITFNPIDNAATPPTFTILATAKGRQAADGNLTLNSRGDKAPPEKW